MDHLWAPWRKTYVLRRPTKKCFICQIKTSSRDAKHFVLKRTRHSFAVLNLFPYNNGHVMVCPKRHVKWLEQLADSESLDLLRLTNHVMARLRKMMKPDGINLGINFGRAAGAGVPGHVHVHVVPRWLCDTNFMPVAANTKVISESLHSAYERLKWNRSRT